MPTKKHLSYSKSIAVYNTSETKLKTPFEAPFETQLDELFFELDRSKLFRGSPVQLPFLITRNKESEITDYITVDGKRHACRMQRGMALYSSKRTIAVIVRVINRYPFTIYGTNCKLAKGHQRVVDFQMDRRWKYCVQIIWYQLNKTYTQNSFIEFGESTKLNEKKTKTRVNYPLGTCKDHNNSSFSLHTEMELLLVTSGNLGRKEQEQVDRKLSDDDFVCYD